ncbi:DUF7916 family protein [Alteribacter natronophilus]|uniref:DUF7916 family protein n=1 Tax=Alteribacter natronophilus TaxID=2583810 RepID=UPI00110F57B8|nr:haloacid dehalogenase-like hydrolase [Alteribacter natronophilus]TMW70939.1 haloacid dehalogenase-like hydrolase [Alteribacter natronophilus]
MKRLLDCKASDFQEITGSDLKQAIRASEGRTVLSEIVAPAPPLFGNVTNGELACAFGADLLLLNLLDLSEPVIAGLEETRPEDRIREFKALTGRPVGINLEPVDKESRPLEELEPISEGRTSSEETVRKAVEYGADFVCLTGNPKTGVTNREIIKAARLVRETAGDSLLIMAGKMHSSGVAGEEGGKIYSPDILSGLIEAGTDVILLPSPGTVPGVTLEQTQKDAALIREHGALSMLTIGTSQEGADESTIRQIALQNKMAGADIHHIGDAGYTGIAVPENIMAMSVAIRGRRHTYVRMASSLKR